MYGVGMRIISQDKRVNVPYDSFAFCWRLAEVECDCGCEVDFDGKHYEYQVVANGGNGEFIMGRYATKKDVEFEMKNILDKGLMNERSYRLNGDWSKEQYNDPRDNTINSNPLI